MAAVARKFSPPRPTPKKKSAPPPLPVATTPADEEVYDVSDTAIHEFVADDVAPPSAKVVPVAVAAPREDARARHPGLVLGRTLGFFLRDIARDVLRSVRAYVHAHWVRAAARART